jgi:hypothetical protein
MMYRIFTENINQPEIEKTVNRYFPGFTILKAEGYWKLVKENSLVIEITNDLVNRSTINQLASDIKKLNSQEAVLVQELNNNSWLI